MEPAHPISRDAAAERTDAVLQTARAMRQQFMGCHHVVADQTRRLAELLRAAESRGVLLHEASTPRIRG